MGFSEKQIRCAFLDLKKTGNSASVESMVSRLVEKEFYSDSDAESPRESSSESSSEDEAEEKIKSHQDFEGLPFEYDSYILENVEKGCLVRSLQSLECQRSGPHLLEDEAQFIDRGSQVIPTGTTGKVLSIDRTAGLLGKSIHVSWNGFKSCWVKPSTIELDELCPVLPSVGDSVRVCKGAVLLFLSVHCHPVR